MQLNTWIFLKRIWCMYLSMILMMVLKVCAYFFIWSKATLQIRIVVRLSDTLRRLWRLSKKKQAVQVLLFIIFFLSSGIPYQDPSELKGKGDLFDCAKCGLKYNKKDIRLHYLEQHYMASYILILKQFYLESYGIKSIGLNKM